MQNRDLSLIRPSSPELERLAYSPADAAALLGIGRTLLYELIDRKQLKSIRIGGRRLITKRAIVQFLADREAQS